MGQVVLGWVTMGGRTVPSEAAKTSLLIQNVFGCGNTGEQETMVSWSLSPVFPKTIYLGEDGVLSAEFTDGYVELGLHKSAGEWRTPCVFCPRRCSVGGGKVAVESWGGSVWDPATSSTVFLDWPSA